MSASETSQSRLARVCRAWHRTCGVEVPTPGIRGAEGKEEGKGVVVRLLPIPIRTKDRTHNEKNRQI